MTGTVCYCYELRLTFLVVSPFSNKMEHKFSWYHIFLAPEEGPSVEKPKGENPLHFTIADNPLASFTACGEEYFLLLTQ